MRHAAFLPVVLSVGLLPTLAFSQQVGDKIVVVTEYAPSRADNKTTGTVPKGEILVAKGVDGDPSWVPIWSGGAGTVKGWIDCSDPITSSQALDFLSEELKRNPSRGGVWLFTECDKALSDLNEAIRLDPKDESAYNTRGMIWQAKGEYDKAISDFTVAIRLNPEDADACNIHWPAWQVTVEYDNMSSDCNDAIRLDPIAGSLYAGRGRAWLAKGEYHKAISEYDVAIWLNPKRAMVWNSRAWLTATCPDAKFRDGKGAVDDATKACKLTDWIDGNFLSTLAAAYAEDSDFANAVKWQEKAIELAPQKQKAELRPRLDLYKAHKPYRDEPKK